MIRPNSLSRRELLVGATGACTALAAPSVMGSARAATALKIGHLTDVSGPYSANSGAVSIACARQAIEDFNPTSKGMVVEYLVGDHQNSTDIALNIVREWFDRSDVDAVLEVNNSAIALALNNLCTQKDKVHLNSGAVTADLTGKSCSPNMVHWTYDSWMLSHGPSTTLTKAGFKTWFYVAPDYAFGASLTRDSSAAVEAMGGKVLGVAKHPFPEVTDFSGFLLTAKASGAQVIAFANGGADIVNCMKQAREFGLPQSGIKMVALAAQTTDLHGMGLEVGQGLLMCLPFYWDLNERTRAFTQRVLPKTQPAYPSVTHAGAYSCLLHYLKAAEVMGGSDKAKASGKAVVDMMKQLPTDDDVLGKGVVRPDGRKIHTTYLFEAKKPADSRWPWDYQFVTDTIAAEQSFRPLTEGGCPFIKL
jgi:branched-chain amino acid transport system substrate-binding protein